MKLSPGNCQASMRQAAAAFNNANPAAAGHSGPRLFPRVEMRAEFGALLAHDAEAVAGRRLHDPPALDERDARRAERFEARDFGVEIVGLDVEMNAWRMVDFLQQQERLV